MEFNLLRLRKANGLAKLQMYTQATETLRYTALTDETFESGIWKFFDYEGCLVAELHQCDFFGLCYGR